MNCLGKLDDGSTIEFLAGGTWSGRVIVPNAVVLPYRVTLTDGRVASVGDIVEVRDGVVFVNGVGPGDG